MFDFFSYRTHVSSVRRFLINELAEKKKSIALQETPADEEAEYQRCLAINTQWNLEIAKLRDIRINEENEKRREQILINIENKKARDEDIKRKIEEKVLKVKEESKTFITRENIDQAIEHALANPINYNFSIDLQGNKSTDKSNEEKPEKSL